ncbi:alpha/beta fold hydrolase [Streptomyces griseorubiginosus]|uniref:alpha/beta fold hydrolase n=1 Tax=Streptomyces griseorubiginosus TaxID=67304 RepID=UPI001AD676A8|nr:alpha/beta hydrolase [Streptomyces griseorubiginosus]MBO4252453.1 alpha/beta fold hydrolase [Streptomyces griseorubiginosus]
MLPRLRPLRRRWTYPVLTFSAALTAFLPNVVGASAAAGSSSLATPKPTIVFVHGAFADSSGFTADIADLQRLGFPVVAAPNPLRGLSSDADCVRSLLRTISGPIVLVGHSYGGAVITNAARGVDNVKALVYVGAFVPDKGESLATVLDPRQYPGSLLGPDTTMTRPVPNPAAPSGQDADIYIKAPDFRQVFAGDVPASQASVMAATQRPLSYTAETEVSGDPAWKSIPSWDLVTLNDKAIPPAGQRFMAERANAHIEYVESSHAVMVSHPQAVLRIVLDAVRHDG